MPKKKINKSSKKNASRTSVGIQHPFVQFLKISSLRTKTLFSLGILLILTPIFFYVNESVQLAFFTPKVVPTAVQKKFAIPVQITIPAVNITLPIEETAIQNNVWGIAQDGISHLAISAMPGENGPIILYGHNTNDRFGPIRWLQVGELIRLTTKDGKEHTYRIVKTMDVDPSRVSILFSQKGETLFLYTCDGFADLERFIVIAKPE